jgi:hypothetical protein
MMAGRGGAYGFLIHNGLLLDAPRAARAPRGGEAVLVRGGVIEAVGPAGLLRRRAGRGIQSFDLCGGTLTPGFVDAHIHLLTWIRALREARFEGAQDEAELARIVRARERTRRPGEWITVRGWVPREWSDALRVRETLDRVSPRTPLVLYAADGHSVWANGAALEAVGIDERTPGPPGGVIAHDARGRLTGHLIEEAANLLRPRVPRHGDPREELRAASDRARALGITAAHDFDRAVTWRAAQDLAAGGRLAIRVLLSVPVASLEAAEALGLRAGFGGARLRVGGVKMFADGTLGSATALLEDPYEGSLSHGIEVTPSEEMKRRALQAAAAGLSVAIHAIGDRAVRHALDAIEAARAEGAVFPGPPRIEHIQLCRAEDFPRFRRIGVLASVQPVHLLTDRGVARGYWGARTERAYAWRSLLAARAELLFGSDAPFDRAGPVEALYAAVHRAGPGERDARVFHAEQRLTVAQALRAHCEAPHRAGGWEVPLGRIEAGYGADLVAFGHDLRSALREGAGAAASAFEAAVRPRATWVAGEIREHTR